MPQDTALTPFDYAGHTVRTVLIDDEPWFVAADVCAVLGLTNTTVALADLDEDERSKDSLGRPGSETNIVNEPGLYSLILRSRKAEAKAFKRWVTHEVLPSLRRAGRYEVAPMDELELAERYVASIKARRELESRVAELAPKAESWDLLATAEGDYLVRDAAKILCRDPRIRLGERRLFTVLAEQGWIYRQRGDGRWRPYQAAIDQGVLLPLPQTHYHPRSGELVLDAPQVRVTVKGLAELHRLLGGGAQLALLDA